MDYACIPELKSIPVAVSIFVCFLFNNQSNRTSE